MAVMEQYLTDTQEALLHLWLRLLAFPGTGQPAVQEASAAVRYAHAESSGRGTLRSLMMCMKQ